VGACHSYVLSGNNLRVLADSSLPLGIFDELTVASRKEAVGPETC
jgi:hypothetical protein